MQTPLRSAFKQGIRLPGCEEETGFANRLVDYLGFPTFVLDADRRVVLWNKACERLTGISGSEVIGTTDQWRAFHRARRPCLAELVVANRFEEIDAVFAGCKSVIDEFGASAEHWCQMPKLGHPLYLAMEAAAIYDPSGKVIAAVETIHDITSQKQRQIELEALANHDGLTGVLNRRSFDATLAEESRRASREKHPLSLLMIDIDFFKPYNDIYGHQKGDQCLRLVAQAILACLSRAGDTVARFGGDEFAVVLPATGLEGAKRIAERIRTQVQGLNIVHSGSSVSKCVTLSIGGVAEYASKENATALIAGGDAALYGAKHGGRNCKCIKRSP